MAFMRRWYVRLAVAIGMAVGIVAIISVAVAWAQGDTPTGGPIARQPYTDWAINALSSRLSTLETQRLDARIAVIEVKLNQIFWVSGTVAVAVIAQLMLAAREMLQRSKNGGV